jgi:HAE1 family hydrophobic/amphiphilic exporter-1
MIFLLILILGILAFKNLPLDIMPDVELPTITVMTLYPGASPEDVEKKVSEPLERILSTVSGIKYVSSTSMENMSMIMIFFNWGTNTDEAANNLRANLDMSSFFLPEEAQKPMLFKFDMSMIPINFWGIEIDRSVKHQYSFIKKNIVDRLMRLKGVGFIAIDGIEEDMVAISLSQKRLEKYGLSLGMVQQLLSEYNVSIPGGSMDIGRKYIVLRTSGEFDNISDIGKIPLIRMGPKTVFLKDIANVKFTPKRDIIAKAYINGKPGAVLMVQKASGENTIRVSETVQKEVKEIEKDLSGKAKLNLVMDMAEIISMRLNNLKNTLIISIILIILIVTIMLMNFRGSIIIALSLPFSLIISFVFMYIFGYTINMMTMASLIIAAGMIVDSAIVIFENIYRHHYVMGEPLKASAIFAPTEVGMAVTASIITTVAIFFPLTFMGGLIGVMFKQLGMMVTIVLLASLITALTLIPALTFFILPKKKKETSTQLKVRTFWTNFGEKIGTFVKKTLNKGGLWISGFALIFIISLALLIKIPKEFMPTMDMGRIQVDADLPTFVNIDETEKIAVKIEKLIEKNIPEKNIYLTSIGSSQSGMIPMMNPNKLSISIKLLEDQNKRRTSDEISNQLKELIKKNIPGIKDFSVDSGGMASMLMGSESGAVLEIYGEDLEYMHKVAKIWKEKLSKNKMVRNVDINYETGKKEIQIIPKYGRTAELGLTPAQIGRVIRTVLYGSKVGTYRKQGDVYDILLNYDRNEFPDISHLKNLIITSQSGKKFRLGTLIDIKEKVGPVSIERKDRERMIKVTTILKNSKYTGKITKIIKNEMKKEKFPGIIYKIGGAAKDMQDSFKTLFQILAFAILLVFMVMASQFESFKEPFIIMFSVPFAFTGVVLSLLITKTTLSVNAMMGLIMLVGIVVNNAIVLVDYINILRKRGMELKESIQIGVQTRLKPILMTALTTIFGMLPLALATGRGSEIWKPIGITVIGGLLVSTLITLILIPNIYYIFEKKSKVNKKAIY